MTRIHAPWTSEQVWALNLYQHSGIMHAFTCPRDHDGYVQHHSLSAEPGGWYCIGMANGKQCDYRQDWAHDFMADYEWLANQQRQVDALKRRIPVTFTVALPEPSYEKVPVEDFPWPCERRDAHGPHEAEHWWSPGDHISPPDVEPYECPGVKAHPATMAGTTYRLVTP